MRFASITAGAMAIAVALWAGSYLALRQTRSAFINIGPPITVDISRLSSVDTMLVTSFERRICVPEAGPLAESAAATANAVYWPLLKLDEKVAGFRVSFASF